MTLQISVLYFFHLARLTLARGEEKGQTMARKKSFGLSKAYFSIALWESFHMLVSHEIFKQKFLSYLFIYFINQQLLPSVLFS